MREVVVEDEIIRVSGEFARGVKGLGEANLESELQSEVDLGGVAGQRLGEAFGEIGTTHASLPRQELREVGGGDTVGGKLGLHRWKALREVAERAAAGCEVPLEPVAVQVNDARQDQIAGGVNRAPGAPDRAIGDGEVGVGEPRFGQDLRAGEAQG